MTSPRSRRTLCTFRNYVLKITSVLVLLFRLRPRTLPGSRGWTGVGVSLPRDPVYRSCARCPVSGSAATRFHNGLAEDRACMCLRRSGSNDVPVVIEHRRVPAGHQAEHALLFAGDKCPNGLGCNLKFGALTRDCDAEPDGTCGIGGGAVPEHTARNVDRLPVRGVDLEADGVSVATAGLGNAAMGCAAGRRPNNNKS